MKGAIILLLMCSLLLSGCYTFGPERERSIAGCECVRANFSGYEGKYLFMNGISKGQITSESDVLSPYSTVTICESRNNKTGICEGKIFEFELVGGCI